MSDNKGVNCMFQRLVLLLIVLFAICYPYHETRANSSHTIGVRVGPNFGYTDYDNPMTSWDPGWDIGFLAGGFYEISISRYIMLVPELRFVRLQNKVDLISSVKGHFNIRHDYIAFPIALRFVLFTDVLFIDIGPEVAILVSAESLSDYEDPFRGKVESTEDIEDKMNNLNVSSYIGVGINTSAWGIPLEFGFRYNYGLTDVAKEDKWISNWSTREISVNMSYLIIF